MKTLDIAAQLQLVVPQLTGDFSDELTISSIGQVASTVTVVTTTDHDFSNGDLVNVANIVIPNSISSLTFVEKNNTTPVEGVATAVTALPHDLAKRVYGTGRSETINVTIEGASDPLYNGVHELLSVINETTFTYRVIGSPVTPDLGSPVLEEKKRGAYNGLHAITFVDATTFTYLQTGTFGTPTFDKSTLRVRTRIWASGSSSGGGIGRLGEAYTQHLTDQLVAFVVFGGRVTSKDRNTTSDAVMSSTAGTLRLQNVLQSFSIYVFQTIPDKVSTAADVVDKMADIMPIFTRALVGLRLDTTLTCSKSRNELIYIGDDVFVNEGSSYIHKFDFENAIEFSPDDSISSPDVQQDDVAIRGYTMITRDETDDSDNIVYTDNFKPDF